MHNFNIENKWVRELRSERKRLDDALDGDVTKFRLIQTCCTEYNK